MTKTHIPIQICCKYYIRCQLCGHVMEVNSLDDLTCSDCGYDKFDVVRNFSDDSLVEVHNLEFKSDKFK